MTDAVDIRCPNCNRWLAKVLEYGLVVCPNCGWEVEVRSKANSYAARNGHTRANPPQRSTRG